MFIQQVFRWGEKKSDEFDYLMKNSGNEENRGSDMYQIRRFKQKSPSGIGFMDFSLVWTTDLNDGVFTGGLLLSREMAVSETLHVIGSAF